MGAWLADGAIKYAASLLGSKLREREQHVLASDHFFEFHYPWVVRIVAIAADCNSVAPRGASEVRVLHHPVRYGNEHVEWGGLPETFSG